MTDSQFMVHVLNRLTIHYELQMSLLRKGIGEKEKPFNTDEILEELSLIYERLSLVPEVTNFIYLKEKKALFTTQFKGN
jgi:hypothetical protein